MQILKADDPSIEFDVIEHTGIDLTKQKLQLLIEELIHLREKTKSRAQETEEKDTLIEKINANL